MIKDILLDFLNRRKNSKESKKQLTLQEIKEFAAFAPQEKMWNALLNYVRSNEITEGQLEELIDAMGRKENTSIARKVRQEIECECDYASELKRLHPRITARELEICCHIIQGRSSKEMAGMMNVGLSTITAYRCRLRTKINVKEGTSLKVYLDSVTRLKPSRSVMRHLNKKS